MSLPEVHCDEEMRSLEQGQQTTLAARDHTQSTACFCVAFEVRMIVIFLEGCKKKGGEKKKKLYNRDCIWSTKLKYLLFAPLQKFANPQFNRCVFLSLLCINANYYFFKIT